MANTPTAVADTQPQTGSATVLSVTQSPRYASNQATFVAQTAAASGNFVSNKSAGATPISIDKLYQGREAGSDHFVRALELLSSASDVLSAARLALVEEDKIACDSEVILFEQLLGPLFECRDVGEGYANVINTIQVGISNMAGVPLNQDQINALWRVIRELFEGPYLSFEESLGKVEELERVGLCINSALISEWVSESSVIGK